MIKITKEFLLGDDEKRFFISTSGTFYFFYIEKEKIYLSILDDNSKKEDDKDYICHINKNGILILKNNTKEIYLKLSELNNNGTCNFDFFEKEDDQFIKIKNELFKIESHDEDISELKKEEKKIIERVKTLSKSDKVVYFSLCFIFGILLVILFEFIIILKDFHILLKFLFSAYVIYSLKEIILVLAIKTKDKFLPKKEK